MNHLLTPIVTLGILYSSLNAAVYVPPKRTAFVKLDLLPIDVATMHALSSSLTQIAVSCKERTPQKLQACSKLLAIASQLHPENSWVAAAHTTLKNKDPETSPSIQVNEAAVASLLNYLSKKELGEEANHLGQRIKNTLRTLQPNNPYYNGGSELVSLSWDGIVAPIDAYKAKPKDEPKDSERISHSVETTPASKPVVVDTFVEQLDQLPELPKLAKWNKKVASIRAPFTFKVDPDSEKATHDTIGEITFLLTPEGDDNGKSKIATDGDSLKSIPSDRYQLVSTVTNILNNYWKDGFYSAKLGAKSNKPISKSSDIKTLTAACAVALDSSLLDKDSDENLIIAAGINSNGTFTRNQHFWDYLVELNKLDEGHRILISKDAENDLLQLLVITDSEIFVNQEIYVVSDLKDSRSYYQNELDGDLKKASELFKEIREVMIGKSIRSMASNSHVKAKLKEVYDLNPNHVSAKMLLILGSSTKPNSLSPESIGFETERILRKVEQAITANEYHESYADLLITSGTEIEERAEELLRYTESTDREIFNKLEDLGNALQSAGKSKIKSKDYNSSNSSFHSKAYTNDMRSIKDWCNELKIEAAKMIGEKESNTPPK